MNFTCLAALFLVLAPGIAWAQDEERRSLPPTEIPDFSNLEEYIYVPKSAVTLGFRHLSGAKTQFSGQGTVASPLVEPGPATGANLNRVYHDGAVRPDGRSLSRRDPGGNPVIDTSTNMNVSDPIAPDGKTNTWEYVDREQVREDGYITFHTYSADVIDTRIRERNAASGFGMEIAMRRDMGSVFGTRMTWNLTAGMSINDITSGTSDTVRASLFSQTDFFSLFGKTPPPGPYSSPSSANFDVLDAGGNTIPTTTTQEEFDEFGNPVEVPITTNESIPADTSVLIGNEPVARTTGTVTDETSVTNQWRVKGAYFTFRAGPTVWFPISPRFRASLSFGAALVYAGTNYTVSQMFQPEFGEQIIDTSTSAAYKLLPGYFADATVQFDLTERSGFFAGAVFQSAGSYTHNLDNASAHYSSKVDLSNQDGLRAGMSIRF